MKERSNRFVFLDNIKVFLIVLVIFAHAGTAFTNWGLWPVELTNNKGVIPHFFNYILFVASFAMSLFLFLSGYFVPMSYDKYGWYSFVKKKAIRLVSPFIVFFIFFSFVYGQFIIGHLWFLQCLFSLCLLYVFLRKLIDLLSIDVTVDKGKVLSLVAVILLIVSTFFIRRWYAVEQFKIFFKIIYIEPAHYSHYIFMFLCGVLEYRTKYILNNISKAVGNVLFFVGFCMSLIVLLNGENMCYHWWYSIYESLVCVIFSVGLICFFKNYINWNSRLCRWAAEQSFGVYIIHMMVLIYLHYMMDFFLINLYLKYAIVCVLGTILSFVFTYYLRRIPYVSKII